MGRNRPSRKRSAARRPSGGHVLAILVTGVVAVSVGIGIASAQSTSPRSQALSQAQANSANWPASKASLYRKGVAQAFPATPAAKPAQAQPVAAPGVPTIVVPDGRTAGISNQRQEPFSSASFAAQNSYSSLVNGRWTVAYAGTIGGDGADAHQGGLRILSSDPNANTNITDLGTFPAAGTASLKVTAYAGSVITLATDTGATLTFDLATLTYQ